MAYVQKLLPFWILSFTILSCANTGSLTRSDQVNSKIYLVNDVQSEVELVYLPWMHESPVENDSDSAFWSFVGGRTTENVFASAEPFLESDAIVGVEGYLADSDMKKILGFSRKMMLELDEYKRNYQFYGTESSLNSERLEFSKRVQTIVLASIKYYNNPTARNLAKLSERQNLLIVGIEDSETYCRLGQHINYVSFCLVHNRPPYLWESGEIILPKWENELIDFRKYESECQNIDGSDEFCRRLHRCSRVMEAGVSFFQSHYKANECVHKIFKLRDENEFQKLMSLRTENNVKNLLQAAKNNGKKRAVLFFGALHIPEIIKIAKEQNIRLIMVVDHMFIPMMESQLQE